MLAYFRIAANQFLWINDLTLYAELLFLPYMNIENELIPTLFHLESTRRNKGRKDTKTKLRRVIPRYKNGNSLLPKGFSRRKSVRTKTD